MATLTSKARKQEPLTALRAQMYYFVSCQHDVGQGCPVQVYMTCALVFTKFSPPPNGKMSATEPETPRRAEEVNCPSVLMSHGPHNHKVFKVCGPHKLRPT